MVWFQCEDCGDNLKKPKLPNHFRVCSAYKLSCIDCGEVFNRQTVESHTQCISEAEKYGPKGQGKAITPAKPNSGAKKKPDVDINVGLSDRPPWFCSLCNTNATSKQALLIHAEGKKHGAKARAFHAKQQPKPTEQAAPSMEVSGDNNQKSEVPENQAGEDLKEQNPCEGNGNSHTNKKRKHGVSENGGAKLKADFDASAELDNGEVIHVEKEEEIKHKKSKTETVKEDEAVGHVNNKDGKKKIKWKRLITSALKSNPDGVLKLKKLNKIVLKSVNESGMTEDESRVGDTIEHKINSSSRFTVDGKYVRLAAKS